MSRNIPSYRFRILKKRYLRGSITHRTLRLLDLPAYQCLIYKRVREEKCLPKEP